MTAAKSSSDGTLIASGYDDGILQISGLDPETGLYIERECDTGDAAIASIELHLEQEIIITNTTDGMTSIWNMDLQLISSYPTKKVAAGAGSGASAETAESAAPVEEPIEEAEPIAMPEPVEEAAAAEPAESPEPAEPEEPAESAEPAESPEPIEPTEPNTQAESPKPPAQSDEGKYEALAMLRYKNSDTISFKFKVSYIPKPYILGLSLSGGYSCYTMLQPFYFGGYIEPHLGIPQKKFPFTYEQNGKPIPSPLIVGGKIYFPFGICVFPFKKNIEFYAELEPGLALNLLWNTKFGKDAITSKVYPAFYGAFKTGVTYKGFTGFIEGNYDAILGFGFSIGIGYNINVQIFGQKQDELVRE